MGWTLRLESSALSSELFCQQGRCEVLPLSESKQMLSINVFCVSVIILSYLSLYTVHTKLLFVIFVEISVVKVGEGVKMHATKSRGAS